MLSFPLSYLIEFTNILNGLHDESRSYTNQIPNVSVNVLSSVDVLEDDFRSLISNAYRDLFFRALDWHGEFDAFINTISFDLVALLEQHTECYRTLPRLFEEESIRDLEAISMCYGD